ncbi:MAG: alternative ribosome rescue aminoacyl-tRNA hydrolase ArfB [Gammaproteobacteria bacterium]|nr:alternative ribosome rescue aminoacyl-tRNA hydrolase ArfB [Gammaproteobacteria bacterium]
MSSEARLLNASNALYISQNVTVPLSEIELSAIRSQGPGGQNVNKLSTAIHCRFDILASSLPDWYKQRLLKLPDHRISKQGVIIIKAQSKRSQERNRVEALQRLQVLIRSAAGKRKPRIATKPTKSAQRKRLDSKTRRGRSKALRAKISPGSY